MVKNNIKLMTPRERIAKTLYGQESDRIALHARRRMIPEGSVGDKIRNLGWGIFGGEAVFKVRYAGIQIEETTFEDRGNSYIRKVFHTSKSDIETVSQVYYHGGMFITEHLFKEAKDYDAIYEMIDAMEFIPWYEQYMKEERRLGESGFPWFFAGYDPMHEIMVKMMGVETFCYEWADNRKEVLEIYHALSGKHKMMYDIVAKSPAEAVGYGANIQANIVTPQMFSEYYIPRYNEFARKLHEKGKLIGTHWDGPFGTLKGLIRETQFDILEAFCPPPDGDVTVSEARKLWPEKIISMNFPSGLQYLSEEEIKEAACMFAGETDQGKKFMISLTEDFPEEFAEKLFKGIAEAVR